MKPEKFYVRLADIEAFPLTDRQKKSNTNYFSSLVNE